MRDTTQIRRSSALAYTLPVLRSFPLSFLFGKRPPASILVSKTQYDSPRLSSSLASTRNRRDQLTLKDHALHSETSSRLQTGHFLQEVLLFFRFR